MLWKLLHTHRKKNCVPLFSQNSCLCSWLKTSSEKKESLLALTKLHWKQCASCFYHLFREHFDYEGISAGMRCCTLHCRRQAFGFRRHAADSIHFTTHTWPRREGAAGILTRPLLLLVCFWNLPQQLQAQVCVTLQKPAAKHPTTQKPH